MAKKRFECSCGKFKVKGNSNILISLEECPVCEEEIIQSEENQPIIKRTAEQLRQTSPTYFLTTGDMEF